MTDIKPIGPSATTWAREHGDHYVATVALDNYEPTPRETAYLACHRYSTDTVSDAFIVEDGMSLRDAPRVILLMDDGESVRPYYVAAWGPERDRHLIVHPFPVNVNEDGSPRLRANDGRPVDFYNWSLGPRRAYHLKLRHEESAPRSIARRMQWRYLAEEREREEDSAAMMEDDPSEGYSETLDELAVLAADGHPTRVGTVYGPTPGYDGDHDLGVAYSVDIAEDDEESER